MNQQIIDNKLIAEFMDGIPFFTDSTHKKVSGFSLPHLGKDENSITGIGYELIVNLKYHKDWNWLMPVVKKICDTEIPLSKYQTRQFWLNNPDIENVYTQVVEFIKWYNKEM